jgi:hypothetical protein
LGHIHHHIAEHHNEAAIGVIHKSRIFGESNHALSGLVVQPQIENGVHHAGHRKLRARTHRDQQRVLRVAESFAHPLLHHLELIAHLVHQIIGQSSAPHIVAAHIGRDSKTGRYRQPDGGHLR